MISLNAKNALDKKKFNLGNYYKINANLCIYYLDKKTIFFFNLGNYYKINANLCIY